MPDAIELLKTRRSMKPREMTGPGPSAAELETILTIGARVPDHGKLAPWRFIVFEGDARARAGRHQGCRRQGHCADAIGDPGPRRGILDQAA